MPYNARQVREYAGGSIGGILRKGGSSNHSNSSSSSGMVHGSTSSNCGEAKQIDLLVFGYACKVFRDDDKAREIDQGKHLIPWMGDSSLKIDRYDVRGALFELSPHEAPPGGYGNRLDYLTADEQRAEQLCEEERYLYLYNNEEQHILHQEEELKRFKQESGAYNQVGFQYGGDATDSNGVPIGPNREENTDSPTCEEADKAFTLPANFVVPPSIQLPESMKQHAIIEKTARFIASQGVQMEILLKAKQSNNQQFEFLTQNSLLNPYYKFVLNAIKEGTYPAEETSKENVEEPAKDSEIKDPEENLPPRPVITVPTIKYKPSANCAYTQLISKIKGVPLPAVIDENSTSSVVSTNNGSNTPAEENFTPVLLQYNGNTFVTADGEDSNSNCNSNSNSNSQDASKPATNSPPKVELLKSSSALLLAQNYSSGSESEEEEKPPPPEPKLSFPIPAENLKNIIDKTATYVIKNGRQFEETLRTKSEERFTFLLPENEFYPYYMYKITGDPDAASKEQKTRKAAAVAAALLSKKRLNVDKNITTPVSFSIKPKDDQPITGLQPALPQEPSDDEDDNTIRQPNSADDQLRSVPEHVKKAIQLVESQLMARNAQLAAVVGAATAVMPCNLPNIRSRFDVDFNGQLAKPILANTNTEIERNAIFEQQQLSRHKELKRAEEKVKDKLAQIAREKLGGLITKEKQLQLERKRKAMAFLNQIKGSSENELTPDQKAVNDDDGASDNSDGSVHSIPITSFGPDEKTDDEEETEPPPRVTVPTLPPTVNPIPKITVAVTLSDDEDDVQVVSETKAPIVLPESKHKSRHRRSRSHTRDSHTHKQSSHSRHSSVESSESLSIRESKSRSSHKSSKRSKKSSSKSRSKKKSKKRSHTRSRSRSHNPSNKIHHHRSRSPHRRSHSRYSRSDSVESEGSAHRSPSKRQHEHHHIKRCKRSRTPSRKEKRRKRDY